LSIKQSSLAKSVKVNPANV